MVGLSAACGLTSLSLLTAEYYHAALGATRGALLAATNDAEYITWKHDTAPLRTIPVRADDATVGPADAPHVLLAFTDFECPHCREFEAFAPRLVGRYGRELRIVVKHYPMSRECCPALPANQSIHHFACGAAVAAEAARRVGTREQAWRYRHALYQNVENLALRPWGLLARRVGIDTNQFERAMADPTVRRHIEEDVLLGRSLGIDGSGALFLDGRRLPIWRITNDAGDATDELQTLRLWDRLMHAGRASP